MFNPGSAGASPSQTPSNLNNWPALLLRLAGLAILAALMMPLPGCAGLGRFGLHGPRDHLAAVRPRFSDDPQLEEVVDHLNRNIQKLHAWKAHSVKIRANNMPGLSGSLAVEEGQHLRMVVNSLGGHEVDMGSNNDVFWIWAKRMEPSYVYCRHEQIDSARQTLGVPFEPHWLMQALGVESLDKQNLKMQIDPTGQRARLVQSVVTAHGYPMEKVMQVDLVHGIITEHCIYDSRGAKIAQARLDDFRVDKATGVILPHRVTLDWPQNKMSLVMNFGHVEINPAISSQIWEMPPPMPGVQVVNLGKESQLGIQFAGVPKDQVAQLQEPEDAASDDDTGRVRLSLDTADGGGDESPFERTDAVSPVEHSTAPIERPGKAEWWDK